MTRAAVDERPHAIDPHYLGVVEQQAGAAAGPPPTTSTPTARSTAQQLIERARAGARCAAAARCTLEQLVQAMEEPATQDLRAVCVTADRCCARSASRATPSCARRSTLLRAWARRGAHRRDLDKDGNYDDDARRHADGRLVAELAEAIFEPALGADAIARAARAWRRRRRARAGGSAGAPDFFDGW